MRIAIRDRHCNQAKCKAAARSGCFASDCVDVTLADRGPLPRTTPSVGQDALERVAGMQRVPRSSNFKVGEMECNTPN